MEKLGREKGELQNMASSTTFLEKPAVEQQSVLSNLSGVEAKLRQAMGEWEQLSTELEVARTRFNES
jgi:hypothetical protein